MTSPAGPRRPRSASGILVAMIAATAVAACSSTERQPAPPLPAWSADDKAELLRRVAEDQAGRDSLVVRMQAGQPFDSATVARLTRIDASNTAWLKSMVETRGWPDSSAIGSDGAEAAFLIVQHADADTTFQAFILPRLEAAWKRGQAEGESVALLTDRLAVARGQRQRFGTQTKLIDGRMVPDPVEDSTTLDARRATMGLPPMRDYLRVLDSVYLGKKSP